MKRYTIEEAAKELDISVLTLRKYATDKIFIPLVSATGRKYYTRKMLEDFLNNTYSPEEQSKYNCLQDEAVEISVNFNKLLKLTGISEDNTSYYKIPASEAFKSVYDVLEVTTSKKSSEAEYVLGRIIVDESNTAVFEAAISWVSTTL